MASIIVGGNDSVMWNVHADRVKSTKTSSLNSVHDQEGTDDTVENGFFNVTITLPSDATARDDFMAQLKGFIANPKGSLSVRFPIEDKAYLKAQTGVHDQITVEWP